MGPAGVVARAVTARPPSLTRTLVRLKIRLMINRARSTKAGWFGLVMSAVLGGAIGVAGFAAALSIGSVSDPAVGHRFLVIGANVLVLGWALFPLATFGSDETLDPAKLVLYPLAPRPLTRALLAAALVGFVPIAVLAVLAGVVISFSSGASAVVAVAAAVLAVLLGVLVSRSLATALAAALTSRRARDAAIVVGSLVFLAFQAIRFIRLPVISAATLDHIVRILRWTPPGMLGQAVTDADAGHWLRACAGLVPPAVLVFVLLGVWARLLDRALTVVGSGATTGRTGRRGAAGAAGRRLPLLLAWLPFLPSSPWGAVCARELRYAWRDPRRKGSLLIRSVLAIGGPIYVVAKAGHLSPASVLVSATVGYLAVLGAFNQFGMDGGALWTDVVAGDHLRDLLIGKNVALLIQSAPPVVVAAVLLAAFSGGWAYIPVALVLALAGIVAGLAVANVVSVRFAQKVPENRSPFGGGAFGAGGGGGGQGCVTGLVIFGCVILQNLLVAPAAVAIALSATRAPAALVIVVPLALAYSWLVWRGGLAAAIDWGWWREPELLTAVDPGRSG